VALPRHRAIDLSATDRGQQSSPPALRAHWLSDDAAKLAAKSPCLFSSSRQLRAWRRNVSSQHFGCRRAVNSELAIECPRRVFKMNKRNR
jgi:hypothetical protein